MGDIKKILAMGKVFPRQITADMIWTDLCEDVHLHYRNVRIDFSEKEFAGFRAAIHHLGQAVEVVSEENQYKEGDPNFLIQQMYNEPLCPDSKYYPNRVTIELERDNTVHFHYRDIRLHWSIEEFIKISEMFTQAKKEYDGLKEFPYKEATQAWVDIDLIQPYDAGHRALAIDQKHRDGIEYVKKLIQDRKHIRPILVGTNGQRLDGFKRYIAHLELGKKKIECIVDPFGIMGGQNNQNFLADEE